MEANRNLICIGFYKCIFFSFLLIIASNQSGLCQTLGKDSINRKRLNLLAYSSTAAYTITMVGLNQVWYSNFDKQPFAFFNDSREWYQMDKAGHSFSTFQLTKFSAYALQWAGLSKSRSTRIGAISSFLMVSSIEIFDGYSSGYGASASDLIANAFGASLYLGQQMLWNEIRLHPKFSFHQTYLSNLRPELLGSNLGEKIIKDYNGQTYWLSVDMDKFTSFPKWLNLAVGYGGHQMVYADPDVGISNGYNPYRQLYLSLDFDLSGIKCQSKGLKTLLYIMNMIKLPSPTLEISNGKIKTHAFYF